MFQTKAAEWGSLGLLALAGAILYFLSRWETRWQKSPPPPNA
jgi:hypothetical protein